MNKKVLKIKEISHNAHNVVEKRLKKILRTIVEKNPNWGWEQISLQDVYACAINRLPAIYSKKGGKDSKLLTDEEIEKAVKVAMYKVAQNPIHFSSGQSSK